jgi:microcystin-dependent protein
MAEALMQFSSGGDAGGIPSGVICMWSGASSEIPDGWALCNGSNGTPDLRNRFIVGAGSSYTVGATGGSDTVTLTDSQMPKHSHTVMPSASGLTYVTESSGVFQYNSFSGSTSWQGYHYRDGSITCTSSGGGSSHENRPPYYALCFIMKL